jgi:flavodoxin I
LSAIIVGADLERSGTGWDEIYYSEMQDLKIAGKKVAVFGLGDSVSYSENYADATGEVKFTASKNFTYRFPTQYYSPPKFQTLLLATFKLHDVFENLGCKMMGYTSTEGYLHDASKSIRGDQFCGLLLDDVNQEELTEERIRNWVAALKAEGILEGGGATASVSKESTSTSVRESNLANVEADTVIISQPVALTQQPDSATSGFVAHYNPRTDRTMWINVDGRSSFLTTGKP